MENCIQLPEKISAKLASLPESGMGYQKVIITLDNNVTLKERIVFNSQLLQLLEGESIDPYQIKEIKLIK